MAKVDEKQVAVARVYSQSLLNLAATNEQAESLLDEMNGLLEVLAAQPAFAEYFKSPLVDPKERGNAIERLLRGRASDLLVDSVQVLGQHGRLGLFETVVEGFRTGVQARQGRVDVEVTTAVPLDAALRDQLKAALMSLSDGQAPDLVEKVDPELLGGMVVRIGDRRIDTTLKKDLKTVRARLADRAAREIYGGRLAAAAE